MSLRVLRILWGRCVELEGLMDTCAIFACEVGDQRLSRLPVSCGVGSLRQDSCHCAPLQANWQCVATPTSVASPTLPSQWRDMLCQDCC